MSSRTRNRLWFDSPPIYMVLLLAIAAGCTSCGLPQDFTIPDAPVWDVQDVGKSYKLTFSLASAYATKGVYLNYCLFNDLSTQKDTRFSEIKSEWVNQGSSDPKTTASNASNKYKYFFLIPWNQDGTEKSVLNEFVPTINLGSGATDFAASGSSYSFTITYEKDALQGNIDVLFCTDNNTGKKLELLRGIDRKNVERRFDPALVLDGQTGIQSIDITGQSTTNNWYLAIIATNYYMNDNLETMYSTPAVIQSLIELE